MRVHLNRLAGASLLAAGFGMAFTASSCTTPATEVVAGFTTQIRVPKDLRSVAVVVTQDGITKLCKGYKVHDGTVNLPSTIGSIPDDERDGIPASPVFIGVFGFRGELSPQFELDCNLQPPQTTDDKEEIMVVRKAGVIYTEDQILFVNMPLKESCTDVVCENDDETCIGGVCEPAEVDSASLPLYREELIFGLGRHCFDPDICTPKGAGIPAVMIDKDDCTFRLAIPEDQEANFPKNPGEMNVEVIYKSLGTEIMDLDDREGFTIPDPDDPWTFRLAKNLCDSQFDPDNQNIVSVLGYPFCPAKHSLLPICEGPLRDIQAGGRGPASANVDQLGDLCPIAPPLQATESLLYVLMDQSAAMSEFFEPGALDFAVGLSLNNPVSARTRFAFNFVPAGACDPVTNPFETPLHGFGDPAAVRDAIGAELGNPANVLGTNDDVNWEIAMAGAYTALHAINDSVSTTFNRKAIVLVGNRDFVQHCGAEPVALAATQLADPDPIHTYVAVLDQPTGSNFPDSPQSEGAAIAQAGGTDVFDGVADDAEGALAVQKVLNDLGSCLYDPVDMPNLPGLPELGVGEEDPQREVTSLTFLNPVTGQVSIVEREDACDRPRSDIDGFGFDSNRQVVICGQPCTTLREALTDLAGLYALQGQAAPALPIIPSLSCTRKAELYDQLTSPLP